MTDAELQTLIDENPFYPYLEVPPHLHPLLPPHILLFHDLQTKPLPPRVRALAQLCRRAFQPYLLGRGWRDSRRFSDSDFRTPIEFVPEFAQLARSRFHDVHEAEFYLHGFYAINLERVAAGLKELLEHFEPAFFGTRQAAAERLQKDLLRRVERYMRTYF